MKTNDPVNKYNPDLISSKSFNGSHISFFNYCGFASKEQKMDNEGEEKKPNQNREPVYNQYMSWKLEKYNWSEVWTGEGKKDVSEGIRHAF